MWAVHCTAVWPRIHMGSSQSDRSNGWSGQLDSWNNRTERWILHLGYKYRSDRTSHNHFLLDSSNLWR